MNDLISRQAAIDVLNKHSVLFGYHLPEEFYEVKQEILGLPSAQPVIKGVIDESGRIKFIEQPERKKGKWLERSVDVDGKKSIEEWQSAKCSVCGRYHTTPYLYYFDDYNFCPNCGAEMM